MLWSGSRNDYITKHLTRHTRPAVSIIYYLSQTKQNTLFDQVCIPVHCTRPMLNTMIGFSCWKLVHNRSNNFHEGGMDLTKSLGQTPMQRCGILIPAEVWEQAGEVAETDRGGSINHRSGGDTWKKTRRLCPCILHLEDLPPATRRAYSPMQGRAPPNLKLFMFPEIWKAFESIITAFLALCIGISWGVSWKFMAKLNIKVASCSIARHNLGSENLSVATLCSHDATLVLRACPRWPCPAANCAPCLLGQANLGTTELIPGKPTWNSFEMEAARCCSHDFLTHIF